MCGIVGMVATVSPSSWDRDRFVSTVSKMISAIGHRGPDDSGMWIDEQQGIGLGHCRLSIVDLSSRGHQPMFYRGKSVIVFNGEIYNHRELRTELLGKGHSFASDTDTEVVLASVLEWGIEGALSRFTGMFAFAFWNIDTRTLYLARDRLGEKPLFVSVTNGVLFFGSELHALESALRPQLGLAPEAIGAYLRYGYVPAPLSMWKGIYKVPPAHFVTVRGGGEIYLKPQFANRHLEVSGSASIAKYWDVNRFLPDRSTVYEANIYVESLEDLLRKATRQQLDCDVPVGIFLSGGIDSTVVAAISQLESSSRVATFTVRFDVAGYDESERAAQVARHIGTDHHEINLNAQHLIRAIPEYARTLDEPTANASYFPLLMMAQQAREHVKVILSGDGGDELFGGYNRYRLAPHLWRTVRWIPAPLRYGIAKFLERVPTAIINKFGNLHRRAGLSDQVQLATAAKKMSRVLRSGSLGESYQRLMWCWDLADGVARADAPHENPLDCALNDFLLTAMRSDLSGYLPDDNLAKADRATMAAGLESRVPLLDRHVVEFACQLPPQLKINAGVSKWLLKQLAYKHVPRQLLDRPKMGFTVPMGHWLKGPLREWVESSIYSESLYEVGMLNKRQVQSAWQLFCKHDAPVAWEMWSIAVYGAWLSGRLGG